MYVMSWEVEYTDEFEEWWNTLGEPIQDAIDRSVHLLEVRGPTLEFPHSSKVNGSCHGAMRELRVQQGGDPYRVFYAFDRRRAAILLLGGNKGGDDRFYEEMVPRADRLFDEHLAALDKEDAGNGRRGRQ